ncbi:hypothetical protein IOD16_03825 [Saccharothrix sp. 6-C]|uniref:hypothetical protein n=1 Tax=Saccharothrix sp. 6-C TaxID=2781735 RepID=UPI001917148E|nr:hypothetical protein [Saccharothrix sp. 6-C]QQQ77652.1 hypothetical protein IOD16_03825 [Saccharothrix sp. 6-C]
MTYTLLFQRVLPDRTFLETLDEVNAAFDPDAEPVPVDLTDEHRAAWDRITRRVSADPGQVTCEEFPHGLNLRWTGPEGTLLLDYDGESASIDIAYRYPGPAAPPIMARAYRIARVVEEESGLEGYDGVLEQPVATGDVAAAAAALGGTSGWAQANLT